MSAERGPHRNALCLHGEACRSNHIEVFSAQVPALASMGIEAQYRNTGLVNAKLLRERPINHRECVLNKGLVDGIRHVTKWQMGCCQRNSQVTRDQQHHNITHVKSVCEILRVAAKRDPRIINDTLLHWRSDHALTFSTAAQFDGEV